MTQRHYVGNWRDGNYTVNPIYEGHSNGYSRLALIDHTTHGASVHMGLGLAKLEPGGTVNPHLHAFEKGFYVLEGTVLLAMNGETYELSADYFGVINIGTTYALANAGSEPVILLEMMSPQPKPHDYTVFTDTYFHKEGKPPTTGRIPDLGDPRDSKYLGKFSGSMPGGGDEISAAGARSDAIQGVGIRELIDQKLHANHLTLFVVEFQPGGAANVHDHMFEESYFLISGAANVILDGVAYHVKAGEYVWTGVGGMHSFACSGDEPVRWIETQAPIPTDREGFRFTKNWEKLQKNMGLHK